MPSVVEADKICAMTILSNEKAFIFEDGTSSQYAFPRIRQTTQLYPLLKTPLPQEEAEFKTKSKYVYCYTKNGAIDSKRVNRSVFAI